MSPTAANSLFAAYRPASAGVDEMFSGDGKVREHWRYMANALDALGASVLAERRLEARRLLREAGATYTIYGDPSGFGRPWELDPVPLLISSQEWTDIEAGLVERAELFDLILRDIYGPQELIKRGLLPMEVVYAHGGFLRSCHPLNTRVRHALTLYAANLGRGPDGRMWVIGDRTQAPSGAGYVLQNRVIMTRILPSLFRDSHVHRLALFFQNLRASLSALATRSDREPRIVILTPGPLNETYFEHSYLAGYLGYNLVEGNDLTVRDGRVWLKSMRRLEPVDVILRRVDDHFCDPLELRPDSRLGVPGLTEAVRRGNVVVVNPLGASVLENPALNAFLPAIAQHYLGRELELPTVASWWCGQAVEREHVIANLDKMVIKPIYREAGSRVVFGSAMTKKQRAELVARIRSRPHFYVGQEDLSFSSVPALADSALEAREAVVRTFLVARDDGYVVLPGALTRVAAEKSSAVVSNQAGGASKDTWILATEPEKQVSLMPVAIPRSAAPDMRGALPSGAADNLFWVGRYSERAEQTIRFVRTVLHTYRSVVEFRDPTESQSLDVLLEALTHLTASFPGFVGRADAESRPDPVPELMALILDGQRRGSVNFDLRALLNSSYAVRDRVSTDTWRVINAIRGKLDDLQVKSAADLRDIQGDLDDLVITLVALSGLTQESMMRGQSWLFLELGRRIERALLLISLVRVTMGRAREPAVEMQVLDALLRSTESLMSYRRGYGDSPLIEPVIGLLLTDDANPRSLAYQLLQLDQRAAELPREDERTGLGEVQRLVLDASSALRLVRFDQLARVDEHTRTRPELESLLRHVTQRLLDASEVMTREYFTDVRGPQQLAPSLAEIGG